MSVPHKIKMEIRCYIAIVVFAALSTVLSYMIWTRLRSKPSVRFESAPSAPSQAQTAVLNVATATTPLMGKAS